jgi:glucan phosphoethanolaminetransferase (alkaline phosphatase superfamily)
MMLLLISTIMIVAYTIYFCIYAETKKQYVSPTSGKCISMSLGMVSSTTIGLILALLFPGELAFSTVLSIAVSFIAAFFIGKIFGLSGIIEAMAASFMGAMMGAMLGDMLPENREAFMIIAMDIIYLISVIFLMLMMNKEAVKENQMLKKAKIAPIFLSLVISLSVIGIAATMESSTQGVNENPESGHEHHQ